MTPTLHHEDTPMPQLPIHTRVVATLGPKSTDYDKMRDMVDHGVRIFRLNFSHASADAFVPAVKIIRQIEEELGIPLTAMGDLCGPKIRIDEVTNSPVQVGQGEIVVLGLPQYREQAGDHVFISLDMPELLQGLDTDMPVSLSDGMLNFVVTRVRKSDQLFEMRATNRGMLTSHKGIAFPGKFHPMPALTDKDRVDVAGGIEIGLDAFALSFVQNHQDVDDLIDEMQKHGKKLAIVSKLERANALDDLDAILERSDAVMVARGDLGLECPLSELPIIQKKIIRAARHAQKASIVATQMLLSMVKNPGPTRAEATDVANAIMDGADCVMLSEETAIGDYPVEAVEFIRGVAEHAESYFLERIEGPYMPKKDSNPSKYLAYAACLLADNLESACLVCHSSSGSTARLISSRRPSRPVYALSTRPDVLRKMNFFFGLRPRMVDESIARHVDRAEGFIKTAPFIKTGDSVVITSGQPTPGQPLICDVDPCRPILSTNEIKVYYK